MKKYIFFSLLISSTLVHGDENPQDPISSYQFIVDRNFSPNVGSENLLTFHRSLEKLDEITLPLKEKQGTLAQLTRASELILLWMPLNYMTTVVQHEVFGHGYRLRDLRPIAHVEKYTFNLPPPYGPGGGATHFDLDTEKASMAQMTSIAIGGVEATGILANRLKFHWVDRSELPAQQSLLYLFSQHDLSLYISSLSNNEKDEELDGHDIGRYLTLLQFSYPEGSLSKSELKRMTRINFFDPFTYFSISSWFSYIVTGKTSDIPMFQYKSVSYLPSARLALSPFGPEYVLDNFIKVHEVPTYFYLKRGTFAHNTYLGVGFENNRLVTYKAHSLGLRLDGWRQPKLLSNEEWASAFTGYIINQFSPDPARTKAMHEEHFGLATQLIYNYALTPERFSVHCQIGYKTDGFLPGESLTDGVLAKLAFSAKF